MFEVPVTEYEKSKSRLVVYQDMDIYIYPKGFGWDPHLEILLVVPEICIDISCSSPKKMLGWWSMES